MDQYINLNLKPSRRTNSIRSIALAAILLALLIVQEELLTGIPQVQLTVPLIILYAFLFPNEILLPLIAGYVLIDNLYMGSISLMYTPAMFIAWILLAVVARKLRNKPDYIQVIIAVVFGFVYGWIFIPFSMMVLGINQFWPYLLADIPAEFAMAFSDLVTMIIVYIPAKSAITLYLGSNFKIGG